MSSSLAVLDPWLAGVMEWATTTGSLVDAAGQILIVGAHR